FDIAKVSIIDVPYFADKLYDYYIPAELSEKIAEGSLVFVPFGGGNKKMSAVVREICDKSEFSELKPILSVSGDSPLIDAEQASLCEFLKRHTLCTFGEALRSIVPSGAFSKITEYLEVDPKKQLDGATSKLSERSVALYRYLSENGKCRMSKIVSEFGDDTAKYVVPLIKGRYVIRSVDIKDSLNIKTENYISLAISRDDASDIIGGTSTYRIRSEGQLSALKVLYNARAEMSESDLTAQSGCSRVHVSSLEKKGLITVRTEDVVRNPYKGVSAPKEEYILSEAQTAALRALEELYLDDAPRAALLYGVTGSGKTAVIKKMIDRVIADGKGVIMLVPEIALTPQAVAVFCGYYGENVSVLHSGLSSGERYDAYRRIGDGRSSIVIGTRSAIFAPLKNIGLIIIDEEQEHTYKSDSDPKYSAHDVARFRCGECGAMLLLASAMPSVGTFYKAVTGKYSLVELKERYGGAELPKVKICDMRREAVAGNDSPLSTELIERLTETSDSGEQSIVFLNRRGYNSSVACMCCGESIKCPNCSVSMTFHTYRSIGADSDDEFSGRTRRGYLSCHYCGHREAVPDKCPSCSKEHFRYVGCGTQKAEEEILRLVPGAKVARMDMDTTGAKFSHEKILGVFRKGDANILLGTQMVAKGHDFPKVTTVGVIGADASLYIEDYRGAERTFSMLTQVIGRAGRRKGEEGVAVIQTLNPDSNVIRDAAYQDYRTFFDREIRLRRALAFPPFCDIVLLTLSSSDEAYLSASALRLSERLRELLSGTYSDIVYQAFGPFENPVYKIQNVCRMRMVIKCRVNKRVRELLDVLMCEFGKNGKKKVTLGVDINPNSI
ncbi:MAG: primosomal protein N', partial [Clostridia bacterium]|nr:primosomal protein N' [Clostridia bacterium]